MQVLCVHMFTRKYKVEISSHMWEYSKHFSIISENEIWNIWRGKLNK